jgi:hypothetical protein
MKKNNNEISQHKMKRYAKNKKRMSKNPYHQLSKFERSQEEVRQRIIAQALANSGRS